MADRSSSLRTLKFRKWWTRRDLNSWPLPCQGSDLPADLRAHLLTNKFVSEPASRPAALSITNLSMVRGGTMTGRPKGDRLTRYVSASVKARSMPSQPPLIPEGLLESIEETLDVEEAPFKSHLARVRVEWLSPNADTLGNTAFEMSHHELEARKRQRLPPGDVTIGLHPILTEDEMLYTHTLAHEFLHAAGLTNHDHRHAELLREIAPPPKLSESPLLQEIRNQALSQQEVQEWTCSHCGFEWNRETVRAPSRCPKCARPFA